MRLQTLRLLRTLLSLAILASWIWTFWPDQRVHIWLRLGLTLGLSALSARLDFRYWRCPHCKKYLGKKAYPMPKTCPHCGWKLD